MHAKSPGFPLRHERRKVAIFGVFLFTLVATLLGANRRANAYRPFDGTDADVAPVGEFELELGPAHYYRAGGTNYVIAPASVLNLGVVQRVELVVDFQNFIALGSPTDGGHRVQLRDTDVLAKIVLRPGVLQGGSGPSLAIEAGPLLPEFGVGTGYGGQANIIVSLANELAAVHFNELIADNRQRRLELFSSAIMEFGRGWRARPVAEVFVDHVSGGAKEYSALLGTIWPCWQTLALDLAARAARLDGTLAWEIRLGFTWSARVWGREGD
jgi:hypothetical protein